MKRIYKYQIQPTELEDQVTVSMPVGAKVLSVQVQKGIVCLWVLINTKEKVDEFREFNVVGTGHDIDFNTNKFVGTFQLMEGNLVFHLFEA